MKISTFPYLSNDAAHRNMARTTRTYAHRYRDFFRLYLVTMPITHTINEKLHYEYWPEKYETSEVL